MTNEIDLRDCAADEHREHLFDVLGETGADDELTVVAERDVDSHLVRYQIEHERVLHWEHTHPDAEPRKHQVTVGDTLDDTALGTIDVRDLKPQRRHEALLQIFDDLEAGEGFVLVNDHDPKPLYHEIQSMHGAVVAWEYLSRESGEWRVEIRKTDESKAVDQDVVTRYDVREIPKQERHPTIHHRYGMIPDGGTMEIVASHEPKPLRAEFKQQYGDSFTWDVVESEQGRCRVHITKRDSVNGTEDASGPDEKTPAQSDDVAVEVTEEFDVRDRPPARRHERIYDAYDELNRGEGFVFVNDHDPKPLYHQFEAEAGPEFHWEYRKQDPGEFKVLIGKSAKSVDEPAEKEVESPF